MRKTSLVLAALLAMAGVCVMLWPTFTGSRLESYAEEAAQTFLEERKPEQKHSELLADLQAYNQRIYAEKQSSLVDLEACEESAADLIAYGIEDEIIGVLEIPAMELTMPVYLGASDAHLAAGAAVLGNTSAPIGGDNTNCVIAGHRGWRGADYFRHNMIRKDLEERHIPNARGGATWTHPAVRGILSNEKYVGDVLMQKTFRQDCISHKAIRNTGQRPMYLVQNNHEAIIDRKTYDAVQTELARRNALKGNTQKSTPSGRSCYTPKYALSDRVICGECGTLYRRCTWVNRGKKHIVWRCISRFDYGKKYCHDSPAVDEQQLQQAILRVINGVMSEKPVLVRRVTENLQVVIRPSRSGELTIAEIDRELEALAREFDTAFVAAASGNSEDYSERFKTILAQQAELKVKRAELEQQQAEDAELTSHMKLAADTLIQADTAIMKWDEYQIRALVESVRILSNDEILVRLKSGIEKIERLQK